VRGTEAPDIDLPWTRNKIFLSINYSVAERKRIIAVAEIIAFCILNLAVR
jgi:hypothetical protein